MKTIVQIAKELKLTTRAVQYRLNILGIKGKKRIKTHYFTDKEIEKISYKKHKNPKYPLLSNPKFYKHQINILETLMYLDKKNISEVSRILNLPLSICERSVSFFKERKCLIIQSKMNYL